MEGRRSLFFFPLFNSWCLVMSSIDVHRFNDDLLANEGDLNKVRNLYPTLEHVLYDQDLIAFFRHYDHAAGAAKTTSTKWGRWAIVLGAVAIALAAIEIVSWALGSKRWPLMIGGFASVCGLASVSIGAFGVLFGPRKRVWLHNRFMGERIRQFHFQSLIARIPQILDSLQDERPGAVDRREAFKRDRHHLLLKFKDQFEGHLDDKFTNAIGPYGDKDWWIHAEHRTPYSNGHTSALESLFDAYRDLRIQHQLGYANYKLQSDHKLFSTMPVRQAEVLEALSRTGIAWLVLIHTAVLAIVVFELITGALGHADRIISTVFCLAIIVIAVVALAARAFQQGLQPEREVERYQQYRSAVQSVLEQFDEAELPSQKLMVMRRMERLTYDEMRVFLIDNERSSFAI
jgi:hypothetical protein